ncbi:hypothetical protein BDM02DRAFT_3121502 [Thelephora ganbajun]|uniref:Uncharacterized protein n=1 Tax=Thelephora ganbajun TaxID=370292 RepID=A0ACB6Z4N1_THEGA|nr:hypothetical protein BDM02DRAFT_3121502 [Thelephora ganbajun]
MASPTLLLTETPSHVLYCHKSWVLCVEWEVVERKLATRGHDGQSQHRPLAWLFLSSKHGI